MTIDEFREELREAQERRDRHVAENLRLAEGLVVVRLVSSRAGDMLVHPSTYEPGRWQVTWFTVRGEPGGHTTYDTREDAIESASGGSPDGFPPYGDQTYRVVRD